MASSAGFFLSPQQKLILSMAPSARTQIAVVIEGEFDEARLKSALLKVVAENEALRTVFQRQTGMKLPFQVVLDACEPVWNVFAPAGVANVARVMESEARKELPADGSQLRSALALLRAQRAPLLASGMTTTRLASGRTVLFVGFAAPSPLGLLGPSTPAMHTTQSGHAQKSPREKKSGRKKH